jgi:TusA-related sulfurtransferase
MARKRLLEMAPGANLIVCGTAADLAEQLGELCTTGGHDLIADGHSDGVYWFHIRRCENASPFEDVDEPSR